MEKIMKATTYINKFKKENKSMDIRKSLIFEDNLISNSTAIILAFDNITENYVVYRYAEITDSVFSDIRSKYSDAFERFEELITLYL